MRLVCLSDTHGLHDQVEVPEGDLLLHAGDFCNFGTRGEAKQFLKWLAGLPHPHKVFIAGNHDRPFDRHRRYVNMWVKHVTYLFDQSITVAGWKIYGSPWLSCSPEFQHRAFALEQQHLRAVWSKIPEDTDILLTHCPPAGTLDGTSGAGCEELALRVHQLDLGLHLFGHAHAGYGRVDLGGTTFLNAAICDPEYVPSRAPVVLDLPDR